ncbi:S41 family peptidase [Chryseobacterium sp. JAH]|uniref:S41 family peptidase n=1 Tax=Chryseobacterium sp. JAH TaxID=1742858 RepID=UPI00074111F9|nr:S41 family peptidase [Chryseobacterium sp. JAH]KUJ52963.1 hypothetical protein AR685_00835 [Chryseobacterium sp. JAH]
MNKNLFSILLLCGFFAQAQLQNSGFESLKDHFPTGWNSKAVYPYEIQIDHNMKYSGNNSLQILCSKQDAGGFQPFSQVATVPGKGLRKIEISAYIKSENTVGDIVLWSQVRDKEKKMIDFGNSLSQGKNIIPNADWKKYSLEFMIDDEADNFLLGGYLSKGGKVWFDDFSITEIPFSQKPASKEALNYINDFKKIIQKYSIFREKVDWTKMETNLQRISKGMEKTDDTSPALQYMLKELRKAGDSHSFIESKTTVDQKNTTNPAAKEPESKLIAGNIGYIMVPGFSSVNSKLGNSFAAKIQQMIEKLDTENDIKGWIVDLRTNTGGNMFPMIAGLGPLIGDGTLGYFTDGKKKTPWKYKNGKTNYTKTSKPYHLKNENNRIAVLIGPMTASSGEATAISFIGKTNVRTFGTPSAGLTSANKGFKLSDGKMILLASSYEMDRTGKNYTGKIQPDELVEPSKDLNNDNQIQLATQWILK